MFAHEAKRLLFAERVIPEYTDKQRAIVARYDTAGALRLAFAGEGASGSNAAPAVMLREAVQLLVRAVAAGDEKDADDEAIRQLDAAHAMGKLRAARNRAEDDDTRRVDAALAAVDPLYFDSLSEPELTSVQQALGREATWLRQQIDLRSPLNVRATKFGRIGAVALLALYLVYAAVGKACSPHNLALGKPVSVSSHQGGTPDPSAFVSGKRDEPYGVCTEVGLQNPYVIVDLQRDADIHEIVVYNRSDQNFDDGLPFIIELSSDGSSFREVARRDKSFGSGGVLSSPWSTKLRARGRYVRIRGHGYIALGQLEVF
jgi:hypothetical protein